MRRQGMWTALALLVGSLASCRGEHPAAARAGTPGGLVVSRGTLEDRLVLTGEIEAITAENMVVPRTPSWMLSIRWLAEDGAQVKKGDRLIEFDASSFVGTIEDKRLNVLRTASELASELAKAESTLAEKRMEVDRKRADLEKAEAEASVPGDLYPRRMHQEKQMAREQKRDALAKAEEDLAANLRAARLEKNVKTVAAQRSERELEDLYKRLEELTIRAPRDGLLQVAVNRRENRKFLVGDQSFPGWVIATMPDLGAMRVRARLPDVDDGGAREGMRADCVLDAYPDKVWPGTVKAVSPVARAEGREATRRFFDVLIALDKTAPNIMRPGMSMRVEVVRRRAEGALLVPRVAVSAVRGKTELHLSKDRKETVEVEWCTELACVLRGGVLEGTPILARAPGSGGAS